jgi:hypothetical protein
MIYTLGQDWRRLFDFVIVNAKKSFIFFREKEAFPGFFGKLYRLLIFQLILFYNYFPGKTTFLMTNSPFEIVNAGMIYMLGQDWRRLFDVVIVNAKKPSFFSAKKRHFRVFSPRTGRLKWQRVVNLQRGKIYSGVSQSYISQVL